jgi:UDPglucose 6-dehydrogenase
MVSERGAGRLRFTTDVDASVAHGMLQFIAVGTPPDEDGSADMQYVIQAARSIGRLMQGPKIVVDKSTVPVGTADRVRAAIAEELSNRGVDFAFSVASNPEFLKEGAAVEDFMRPDRVVVGASDERAIAVLRAIYAPFMRNHERFLVMDVRSAELTKYAANAMLATRISFMNEVANLADLAGCRHRNGSPGHWLGSAHWLSLPLSGRGLRRQLLSEGRQGAAVHGHAVQPPAQAARGGRNRQRQPEARARRQDRRAPRRRPHRPDVCAVGLAFKPNTDDMREAPSRVIVDALTARGARIVAYDPVAMSEAKRVFGGAPLLSYAASPLAACEGADALVVVTEWKEFRSPDFEALKLRLRTPLIFDGRNLYNPVDVRGAGIEYIGIGRR